jgi:hypothetical protein
VSTVVTLRLPHATAERLKAHARRAGRSVSEVGARSIEEWLRQQELANIEFRSFGEERFACLTGSLPIWQVILVAQGYDLDPARTAAHFEWPVHRVQAALNYYGAYPAEIDQAIADNRAMTFERLRRILPGVERFSVPPSVERASAPT